jgi:hypothetical protein
MEEALHVCYISQIGANTLVLHPAKILEALKQSQPTMAQLEASIHAIHRPSVFRTSYRYHRQRIHLHPPLHLLHFRFFPLVIQCDTMDQSLSTC